MRKPLSRFVRKYRIILVLIILFLPLLYLLNPGRKDLMKAISSERRYFILRTLRDTRPITYRNGDYYRGFLALKRKNLLFFSFFQVDYGWYGTLKYDGNIINQAKITDNNKYDYDNSKESILGVLGFFIPLENKITLNFKP